MNEPIWISEQIVLAIHSDQIAWHGGSYGTRDENLLGTSLARPRHLTAYSTPTIFDLAAAYGYGLVKNHDDTYLGNRDVSMKPLSIKAFQLDPPCVGDSSIPNT